MKPALLIVLVVLSSAVRAQVSSIEFFRQGEVLFHQQQYHAAEQYYEHFLGSGKTGRAHGQPLAVQKKKRGESSVDPKQAATYHLAECYRRENDYVRAEAWYAKSCAFPGKAYPERRYWYAVALRANGKYAQAIEELTVFEKQYNDMGPVLIDADRELAGLRFVQEQLARTNKNNFRLLRQSGQGNTSAYAMSVKRGDTMVFTGIHAIAGTGAATGPAYRNDLYTVVQPDVDVADSGRLGGAVALGGFGGGVGGGEHTGLTSFSADGQKMYCTRWTKVGGKTHAAIWFSRFSDSGWSALKRMDEPVNVEGYNTTQPFLTTDGRYLLFASDRPGGIGNYDLWFASLDTAGEVLSVSNVGGAINTAGDEESPYYHSNSRTLVFASNGRPGMGGFDLYYSMGNFEFSRWSDPMNPGVPINSSRDDLYFVSTDEDNCWNTGWVSSDRDGGCCLALYTVLQDNTQTIAGRIVGADTHEPMAGVRVALTDTRHGGRSLGSVATDSLGHYQFVLKNISRFDLRAEKAEYLPGGGNYVVHIVTGKDSMMMADVVLDPVPLPVVTAVRNNILGNFPYKRSVLPGSAKTILDSVVLVLKAHPENLVLIEGYTDGIGGDKYNLRLAQARVDVCIRYLLKQGISRGQVQGKAKGKCCPLAPDTIDGKDNPAGREVNRRVEYHILRKEG